VTAFGGFSVAEWASWIAILVYAYDVGGSSTVGLVVVIQLVPAAVFSPFGGALGDRYQRQTVLVVSYGFQAVAAGLAAVALLLEFDPWVVYVGAAGLATAMTVTRPVQGAMLPDLAKSPEELAASNSVVGLIEGAAVIAGPLMAALLLGTGGPGVVLAIVAVLLALAAFIASTMVCSYRIPLASEGGLIADTLDGMRRLAAEGEARIVLGMGGVHMVVSGALDVLIVALAIEVLGRGDASVGFFNAAFGIGVLIGAGITVGLVGRKRLAPVVGGALLLWGLPLVVLGLVPGLILAVAGLVVVGVAESILDVSGRALLQRLVPGHTLTRAFGILESLRMAGVAAGSALIAVVISGSGPELALTATGLVLPLLALVGWRWLRAVDAAAVIPTEEISMLARVSIFKPLQPLALESIALNLQRTTADAGSAVVVEGDRGCDLYVIIDGNATVTSGRDEVVVNRLGPADYFGEIALMYDRPRVATVRADEDLDLYVLDRDVFLSAVSGHPVTMEATVEEAERRLGRLPGDDADPHGPAQPTG
jgi:MFS family permease